MLGPRDVIVGAERDVIGGVERCDCLVGPIRIWSRSQQSRDDDCRYDTVLEVIADPRPEINTNQRPDIRQHSL